MTDKIEIALIKKSLDDLYKNSMSELDVFRLETIASIFLEKATEIRGKIDGQQNAESNTNQV